jgi:hypothetical protein
MRDNGAKSGGIIAWQAPSRCWPAWHRRWRAEIAPEGGALKIISK